MIFAAYLAGSISSAILICQLRGLPDPRTQGSKNPGATNVMRIGGVSTALMVLIFDMLKGAAPAYIAYILGIDPLLLGQCSIWHHQIVLLNYLCLLLVHDCLFPQSALLFEDHRICPFFAEIQNECQLMHEQLII